MQAIDEQDHLRGRGVDQGDVRRVQAATRQGADCHRFVIAERCQIHRLLVLGGVGSGLVPNAGHALAGKPLLVAWRQANHRTALIANQVGGGDAHRPTVAAGLADDLIGGVNVLGTANARHGFHFRHRCEQLHADGRGAQAQKAVEAIDQRRPVDVSDIRGNHFAHGAALYSVSATFSGANFGGRFSMKDLTPSPKSLRSKLSSIH